MNYEQLDNILEPLMTAVRRAERFLGPDDGWAVYHKRTAHEVAQRLSAVRDYGPT